MMRRNLVIILLLLAGIAICLKAIKANYNQNWGRIVQINDVSKKGSIILYNDDKGNVWGIRILITGYIDGDATIERYYMDGEKITPYDMRAIPKGKVSLSLGGDWYSDRCWIDYTPEHAKTGNLKIRYQFETLPRDTVRGDTLLNFNK